MERLDTTVPPTRSDVAADLTERFGDDATIRPRRRWWPRPRTGRDRTLLDAEVLDGARATPVWLDLPLAPPTPAPTDFRVGAVIAVHNEQDVLDWTVRRLVAGGALVAVLDHGSTDATPAVLDDLERDGLLLARRTVAATSGWQGLLEAKLTLVDDLDLDWALHTDADEARSAPWPGVSLRDAVWAADQAGANVLDFTIVNHLPVHGVDPAGPDDIPHVDLGLRKGYFMQQKAWRTDAPVDLAATAGHRAGREDAVVFPCNFRCDHYPVRSQAHGERKIAERRARLGREREQHPRRHSQYDHVVDGHAFGVRPGEVPVAGPAWDITNRARLLFRSGMTPQDDYRLV